MGILKKLFGIEGHKEDVIAELSEDLEETMKLIKLSGVTEEEVKELRDRMMDLGFKIKMLVARDIKLPENLIHSIEALEENLGLELKKLISEEEIIEHDLNSARLNLRDALKLVSSLEEKNDASSLEGKKEVSPLEGKKKKMKAKRKKKVETKKKKKVDIKKKKKQKKA
jgi:hypothetical protein